MLSYTCPHCAAVRQGRASPHSSAGPIARGQAQLRIPRLPVRDPFDLADPAWPLRARRRNSSRCSTRCSPTSRRWTAAGASDRGQACWRRPAPRPTDRDQLRDRSRLCRPRRRAAAWRRARAQAVPRQRSAGVDADRRDAPTPPIDGNIRSAARPTFVVNGTKADERRMTGRRLSRCLRRHRRLNLSPQGSSRHEDPSRLLAALPCCWRSPLAAGAGSATPTAPTPAAPVAADQAAPAGTAWVDTVAKTPEGGYADGQSRRAAQAGRIWHRAPARYCAKFDAGRRPGARGNYIAAGKVSYEFRNYPVHGPLDLGADPARPLRSTRRPSSRSLDQMLANQQTAARPTSRQCRPRLKAAARRAGRAVATMHRRSGWAISISSKQRGMPEDQARACLTDTGGSRHDRRAHRDAPTTSSTITRHADLHHQRREARTMSTTGRRSNRVLKAGGALTR